MLNVQKMLASGDADLSKLVVAPSARRKGIGRAILAHAVALAHQGHARRCTLLVDEQNAPAQRLYQSEGFAVTARRADYYRPGRSALEMGKQLE